MMHQPSYPSWIPRFSAAPGTRRERSRIAVTTLAIALLLVATVVWLVAAYL